MREVSCWWEGSGHYHSKEGAVSLSSPFAEDKLPPSPVTWREACSPYAHRLRDEPNPATHRSCCFFFFCPPLVTVRTGTGQGIYHDHHVPSGSPGRIICVLYEEIWGERVPSAQSQRCWWEHTYHMTESLHIQWALVNSSMHGWSLPMRNCLYPSQFLQIYI